MLSGFCLTLLFSLTSCLEWNNFLSSRFFFFLICNRYFTSFILVLALPWETYRQQFSPFVHGRENRVERIIKTERETLRHKPWTCDQKSREVKSIFNSRGVPFRPRKLEKIRGCRIRNDGREGKNELLTHLSMMQNRKEKSKQYLWMWLRLHRGKPVLEITLSFIFIWEFRLVMEDWAINHIKRFLDNHTICWISNSKHMTSYQMTSFWSKTIWVKRKWCRS